MAKQRKSSAEKDKMQAAAARPGQKALGVYIDEKLADALSSYLEATRPKPSKTSVVEAALEDYLAGKGFWPPAPPDSEGE